MQQHEQRPIWRREPLWLIAAGLFTLTFAWNDFVVAVAMNSSDDVRTLPVAIYNYLGFFGREWGPRLSAASECRCTSTSSTG